MLTEPYSLYALGLLMAAAIAAVVMMISIPERIKAYEEVETGIIDEEPYACDLIDPIDEMNMDLWMATIPLPCEHCGKNWHRIG